MNVSSHRLDVVVIGGGLAGLTAATHAARGGARVAVLESANRPGGRARTDVRDGVSFNQGPHALYESVPGWPCCVSSASTRPAPTAATGPAVWRGRTGRLPFDARSLATTRLLSPRSRLAFASFHTRLGTTRRPRARHDSVARVPRRHPRHRSADLRAVVEGVVRLSTYADAPELHSAGAAIDQLVLAGSGVRYLHGGWGPLVERSTGRPRAPAPRCTPGRPRRRHRAGSTSGWAVVDGQRSAMAGACRDRRRALARGRRTTGRHRARAPSRRRRAGGAGRVPRPRAPGATEGDLRARPRPPRLLLVARPRRRPDIGWPGARVARQVPSTRRGTPTPTATARRCGHSPAGWG
jgi:hypothetical protein